MQVRSWNHHVGPLRRSLKNRTKQQGTATRGNRNPPARPSCTSQGKNKQHKRLSRRDNSRYAWAYIEVCQTKHLYTVVSTHRVFTETTREGNVQAASALTMNYTRANLSETSYTHCHSNRCGHLGHWPSIFLFPMGQKTGIESVVVHRSFFPASACWPVWPGQSTVLFTLRLHTCTGPFNWGKAILQVKRWDIQLGPKRKKSLNRQPNNNKKKPGRSPLRQPGTPRPGSQLDEPRKNTDNTHHETSLEQQVTSEGTLSSYRWRNYTW